MIRLTIFLFFVDDLATACGLNVVFYIHIVDQVQKHRKVFECNALPDLWLVTLFTGLVFTPNHVISRDDLFFHVTLSLLGHDQLFYEILFLLRVVDELSRELDVRLHRIIS